MARDDRLAALVARDYTQAELTVRERSLADFAVKVTRSPDACGPEDLDKLRSEGLTDGDILALVEIIAYQNMSTRIMESLSTIKQSVAARSFSSPS